MSKDQTARTDTDRLRLLIDKVKMPRGDLHAAKQCLRRLKQPLRLTIFGTDAEYAVPLLNLLIGQSVISPAVKRARIQFFYSEVPYAQLQYRNGSQKRLEGHDFRRLFEDNPSRMRVHINLPVLRRMSMLLALDNNPKALCADADKTILSTDVAIWTGNIFTDEMKVIWDQMPEALRDHSYLALAQRADITPWQAVQDGFVDVLRVNPIRAHNARADVNGADKEGFRAAGGTLIVKAMKSEIEMLTRSAEDTCALLLARYAEDLATVKDDTSEDKPKADTQPAHDPLLAARVAPAVDELPSLDEFDPALVRHLPKRPKSMPKVVSKASSELRAQVSQFPTKNMPVRTSRPISKLGSKPRIQSRIAKPPHPSSPVGR